MVNKDVVNEEKSDMKKYIIALLPSEADTSKIRTMNSGINTSHESPKINFSAGHVPHMSLMHMCVQDRSLPAIKDALQKLGHDLARVTDHAGINMDMDGVGVYHGNWRFWYPNAESLALNASWQQLLTASFNDKPDCLWNLRAQDGPAHASVALEAGTVVVPPHITLAHVWSETDLTYDITPAVDTVQFDRIVIARAGRYGTISQSAIVQTVSLT